MSGAWVPQQFATGANSGATSGPIAPTTYPQKVAAGSLLVCVAYWLTSADTVTVADNVDGAWTAAGAKVYDTATATAMQVFFLAKATTADTTPRTVTATISANDTYTQLNVYEFHHTNGALTGTPTTDGYAAKANGTSSAAPTATAITTATAGDLIFSTIIGPNSSTVSPGAGYAPGGANAGGLTGDEYLTQVTAGSITPAFVASPAMAYSVIDVAIKATVPTVTPVSSSNASTTTTGTAVTCTLPTWTIGNGDPIFLLVAATVSTTISTPTGYWPVMQTQPGTPTVALFMKYARSGDSGASVSATLGAPAGWSVIAYVPTPGSATAYTVDANSVSANHAASLTGAFAAAARSTSNVPTVGTVNGAIGIEFFAGLPGSGQTDTLTVPTGYGNSVAKASTKTTSVNVSAMVCSTTTATITAGASYTPPSVTQSVSVKFSDIFISLVPVASAAMPGVVQYATFGGNGTAPSFGAGGAQLITLPKAPTIGNLLVLALTWATADDAAVSMTPAVGASGGFTVAFGSMTGGKVGGPNGVILSRIVQSGDDAWTITDTNGWVTASMWEFSNPNPTTPFDGTPTWKSNTGAAALPTANAITPSNANDVAISFITQDGWPDYNIVGAGSPWSNFTPAGMQNSALYQAQEWAYYNNPPVGTALNSNWTTSTTGTSQYAITFLVNQAATGYSGTASTSGSGTVSASSQPNVAGAAATSGAGTVTAAASSPGATATASTSGAGTVTAAASNPTAAAAASTSGSGTVTAAAAPTWAGGASVSGSGSVSAAATPSWAGGASVSGAGTVSAVASAPKAAAAANTSGAGTVSVGTSVSVAGAASTSGSGTVTATSKPSVTGAAATSGSGTVTAAASSPSAVGSAATSGTGTVTASTSVTVAGAAATSGSGTVTAAAKPATSTNAATSSTGTVTASAASPTSTATANTSGSGTVTVVALPQLAATASTSGAGTVSAIGSTGNVAAASTSGTGTVTAATSLPNAGTTAATSGAGTVTAASAPAIGTSASTSGSGTVTATAIFGGGGTAAVSGSGTVSATGKPAISGTASPSGSGTVTATASAPKASATASTSGTGSVSASTGTGYTATASTSGSGTVTAIATSPKATGSASTSGSGVVSATVIPGLFTSAALSGDGTVTASVSFSVAGHANTSGSGTVEVGGAARLAPPDQFFLFF
jgi:hypothetical protein